LLFDLLRAGFEPRRGFGQHSKAVTAEKLNKERSDETERTARLKTGAG